MHSGQRLCSGHLSNEDCKVLTSSFGHLFPPFPLLSLGRNGLSFPFYHAGPRAGGQEAWGRGWAGFTEGPGLTREQGVPA